MTTENERVRDIFTREAGKYDRQIGFFEKLLFGGGREWVCSQARGDVLEIAAGTGRNLAFYPPGINLTTTEFTPAMLEIAKRRQVELGVEADLRVGDAQRLELRGRSHRARAPRAPEGRGFRDRAPRAIQARHRRARSGAHAGLSHGGCL